MLNNLKPKSEFSRNVLTLMTGTTIAQAIPIVISPILTRIYTPEDFGIFALYLAIVSFISIIVAGRYELAIILPKDDKSAVNILALSLIIIFTVVIFSLLFIIIFKESILHFLNAEAIGNFIYFVPFSILLAGLYQSLNYWANRKKYFSEIAASQIKQSMAIGISQPLFGYLNIVGGLIFGNVLGRVVSIVVLLKTFIKNDTENISHINQKSIISQMKKYKDFPFINSLHAFSDILRVSGSVMLISSFFGASMLGFYALSLRVLQVPVGIIGSALGQVLYQKFTMIHNNHNNHNNELYFYVKKILLLLVSLSIPLFTILYFITPSLFAFIFGENWRIAGEYSQLLIPYLFMNFILSPISQLAIILNKQKDFFYLNLLGNIGMPLVIYISYIFGYGIKTSLFYISLLFFILYIYILLWILSLLRNKTL